MMGNALSSLKIKKVMTSLDLAAIVKELREIIVGSRIGNIYQINPSTFLFKLYPKRKLIVEAGRRVHLTRYEVKAPPSPPLFCRVLRKILRGGIIQDVQIEEFERIVTIKISSRGTSCRLVTEVFGRGNLVLVDGGNKILHALSYRRMRDRNVLRGEGFKFPPSRGLNPLKATKRQMKALRDKGGTVIQALTKLLSIGGLCAEEAILRAGIDKRREAKTLTDDEVDKVHGEVTKLTLSLEYAKRPNIVVDRDGGYIDVLPFPFSIYGEADTREYPSFNEAADEYFTKLLMGKMSEEASKEVTRRIEEQRRIQGQQQKRLKELKEILEESRLIGDIIYSHTTELQKIIQKVIGERERGKEWNEVASIFTDKRFRKDDASADYFDSIDAERGVLKVEVGGFQFELSLRKTIYENASSFYEKSKEAKAKIEGLKKAIVATERRIEELKQRKVQVEEEHPQPVRPRERLWFEKFHWAYSSEGFLILGGRDATTNEVLIKKHTAHNDIVLHADFTGAPFVTIKSEGKIPSEKTVFEAAQLAASYSRAWREGLTSLDVYWVKPDQISKEAPSGEYLSKGMFMVRGRRNYIHNVPLRVSIGIVEKDDRLMVIGGPVSAIASQTRFMVKIVPGRDKSGRLAKEIRHLLSDNAPTDLRGKILKTSIEEVQRFIPAGKGEAFK
jgi:predicted ribosome quality control (RQC) complex YloA/Tae2 family protein